MGVMEPVRLLLVHMNQCADQLEAAFSFASDVQVYIARWALISAEVGVPRRGSDTVAETRTVKSIDLDIWTPDQMEVCLTHDSVTAKLTLRPVGPEMG